MKKIYWLLIIGASLLGWWGLAVRFQLGEEVTHTTNIVPWGLWVASYIYFIALSAGAFMFSTLPNVFGIKKFEGIQMIALIQAIICLFIGLALVFIDLGHPERFFSIIFHFNPSSVMSWMSIFYPVYIGILFASLFFMQKNNRKMVKTLGILGIPTVIVVEGGVGSIFATIKAQPIWHSGLMPFVFVISAFMSGGALLAFLLYCFYGLEKERKKWIIKQIATLVAIILVIDTFTHFVDIFVVLYGGIPAHVAGYRLMLFSSYWPVFWILHVGLGTVLPLILIFHPKTNNSLRLLSFASLFIAIGNMGLRLNIVIPPLIYPAFESLPEVVHHPRFQASYFPSGIEWLCLLGIIMAGVWAFILAKKVFTLDEKYYETRGV
jgi:Ni/Fe-hydrogenase subunit HybB-like protein